MRNLILISFIFCLQSCKKENYTEVIKSNNSTTKVIYKQKKIFSSEVYNKAGQLDSKYLYSNGVANKIYQYYPDKKVNSYSYLHKAPNHYTTKVYYRNGKISSEGEGDFFKDKNLFLRRGPWLFYSKTGESYAIYIFGHNGNNQYIEGETLFDTIQKKITKDVIFNPPVLYEKEVTATVNLNNPK